MIDLDWLSSCNSIEGNNIERTLQKKRCTRWKADSTCKNPRSGVKCGYVEGEDRTKKGEANKNKK